MSSEGFAAAGFGSKAGNFRPGHRILPLSGKLEENENENPKPGKPRKVSAGDGPCRNARRPAGSFRCFSGFGPWRFSELQPAPGEASKDDTPTLPGKSIEAPVPKEP